MVVVHRAVDLATHPIIAENLHQFIQFIFKLRKTLGHGFRLACRSRGKHHHLGSILVKTVPQGLDFGSVQNVLDLHRTGRSVAKGSVGNKTVTGLLDFLDKGFLAVRRHHRLAAALQHRKERHDKEVGVLAMENPRTVFARFQEPADLGDIGNEFRPSPFGGSVETDDGPVGAAIPLQIANGNVGLHLLLHHFTDHEFNGKQNAD